MKKRRAQLKRQHRRRAKRKLRNRRAVRAHNRLRPNGRKVRVKSRGL